MVGLTVVKSFSIAQKASRKASAKGTTKAVLGLYKARSGKWETRTVGHNKPRSKNPIAQTINAYYAKGGKAVSYVYGLKGRELRGTDDVLAVRLQDRTKGWITSKGTFVSERQIRNELYAIDRTASASLQGVELLDVYDSLAPAQKAGFVEKYLQVDWERFWNEMYDGDKPSNSQYDTYLKLVYDLGVSARFEE